MITTTFRQAVVNFYSWEEWTQLPAWGRDLALGYYSQEDNQIHILKDMNALRKAAHVNECGYLDCYQNIPDSQVKHTLYHEYTHFLQWKLGGGKEPLPILPTELVPLKVLTKKVYRKGDWLIEAEAAYLEKRPQLLDQLEAIVEASISIKVEEAEEECMLDAPPPPFDYFQLGYWKVEDLRGDVWNWSPTFERWEPENLYEDYDM